MFKHILVPTDLTERTGKALEIAVKMALAQESRITLLHVIETIQDAESGEFQDFYERLGKRAARLMDRLMGQYQYEQFALEKRIIYGRRAGSILKFANDEEVDVIVLSSHKVEMENPTQGWGTISYKVGLLSHCPVMLVK